MKRQETTRQEYDDEEDTEDYDDEDEDEDDTEEYDDVGDCMRLLTFIGVPKRSHFLYRVIHFLFRSHVHFKQDAFPSSRVQYGHLPA